MIIKMRKIFNMDLSIKKLKYIVATILGAVIIFFFLILNIFFNIRFGMLYTGRVGHLTSNMDSYLSSRKDNEIAIFGIQKRIANYVIFNSWKNSKRIYFSKIGLLGDFFLKNFFPDHKMLINWDELQPNYSSSMIKRRNIKIEKIKKINVVGNFNQKKPFICFHNRDDSYLKSIGGGGDLNDHDYRDYKFNNYTNAINFVTKKKIQAVRIGRVTNEKFKIKNKKYYDYSNKNSNDINDIFLIKNCEFLVSSATGLSNIASILRKKTLFVNHIPFTLREMYIYTPRSIFIPKKLFLIKEKRFLKFHEIESLKYDIHEKKFFEKRGLRVVNNTQNEINMATQEMLQNYKKKEVNIYNTELHNRFWSSLEDQRAVKIIRHKLKFNICNSFLLKNKRMI